MAKMAQKDGASILIIEGTIANERLLPILQRRFKDSMLSSGANETITLNLMSKKF